MTLTRPDASAAFALHRKALASLSRSAVVATGDLEHSIQELTELASKILDVERASVWKLSADGATIDCLDLYERGAQKHSSGIQLPRSMAPAYFEAVESLLAIPAHDALTDPRTCEFSESYLKPLGITSMLDVPVFRGDKLFGVICHEHIGPARTWTDFDEILVNGVADMLALVLTIAERDAAERALAAQHEKLEALVEQRTAELRRTEAGLRTLFERAPVAVLVVGAHDGKIRLANQRASVLFEIPLAQVSGMDPAKFFRNPAELATVLERTRADGQVQDHRVELVSTTGKSIAGEIACSSLLFEGTPVTVIGVHDITKQHAAEILLRERSELMHRIFTAAPIPLVLTGLDDAIIRVCNQRAAELFGIKIEDLVGNKAPNFYYDPKSREYFVERLKKEGRVDGHPALLKTSAAAPFWALMSAHTLEIGGERMFLVGFVNISREKETEAELQRLNTSLSGALHVLEERDHYIREDLEQAQAFQRLILPALPRAGRLRFAALFQPTVEVGGDIYDVFELAPGSYRVFVADARGHGVQAALRTMLLKSEYDRIRGSAQTPSAVLEQLNQRIYHRYPGMDLQCTAACVDVTLEGDGARVIYASAACPPFIHITSTAANELILSGPYLGVLEEIPINSAEVKLAKGERFVVYTDGLYEQTGADGRMYGVDQLLSDMTLEVPLDQVPVRVQSAVEAFAGSKQLVDDVTLVVVEVT